MTYDDMRRIVYYTADSFSVDSIKEAAVSISEIQEGGDPRGLIVDLHEAKSIDLDYTEVMTLPEFFNDIAMERRLIRTAIVIPEFSNGKEFFLLKSVYARNGIELEIFKDMNLATTWIQSW